MKSFDDISYTYHNTVFKKYKGHTTTVSYYLHLGTRQCFGRRGIVGGGTRHVSVKVVSWFDEPPLSSFKGTDCHLLVQQ